MTIRTCGGGSGIISSSSIYGGGGITVLVEVRMCIYVCKALAQLSDEMYRSGLDTESLDPSLWCSRVQEYVTYEVLPHPCTCKISFFRFHSTVLAYDI